MSARRLDGAALAKTLRQEVAAEVSSLTGAGHPAPALAVILASDDPASAVYVGSKSRACQEVGMASQVVRESAGITTEKLLAKVSQLNDDDAVDGILVQLPLPDGVNTQAVLDAVHPDKDVDGFHPLNAGALAQGRPRLVPCTPAGVVELLRRESIPMTGARAVIVGRSLLVGKPLAFLLLMENATVTLTHSRTRDLPGVCREADILVAAIGRPGLVTDDFVRPGATVIDVGINRVTEQQQVEELFGADSRQLGRWREKGNVLVGDVHPRRVLPVAGALSPVPGGVGPLTVAMLLKNTLTTYRRRRGHG